jgi:hypothetical protein
VSGNGEFVAYPHATADAATLPSCDVVIVATKATDVGEAVARLSRLVPDACVMTTQNGLGADQIVRRFGPWQMISAVTFMSGRRDGDTDVEYEMDTATWLGPSVDVPPTVERVAAVGEPSMDRGNPAPDRQRCGRPDPLPPRAFVQGLGQPSAIATTTSRRLPGPRSMKCMVRINRWVRGLE